MSSTTTTTSATPLGRQRSNTMSGAIPTHATPQSFEILKRMATKHSAAAGTKVSTRKSSAAPPVVVVTAAAAAPAEDSPSKKRKERHDAEPTTPRHEKKKLLRKEKDLLTPQPAVATPLPSQPDTPIPSSEGRPRFKRSNTLSKMGGALKRGLSKTFSKKKVSSSSTSTTAAPLDEEKRRKTANVHELLQNANAQLSGRFWRAPLDAVGVMALYDKLLQWMAQHAVTIEGIFRKSPQNAQFIRLRNFIESKGLTGDVPADTDPYLVANLIKTLLGELPGSILTRSAFGLFADAAGSGDDNDDAAFAAELRALIDAHLPKRNQRLLADLFALCRVISTVHVEETKMTSSNLATCISPNFVTPLEELFNANQSSLLQAYKLFHRVTRVLIDSYDAIFEPATDSFAAEILRAHNVPKAAAVAASEMDSDDNTDDAADDSDVVEAVVVMAPIVDAAATSVAVEAAAPEDDGNCFDDSLPLDFATPLERLAAFKRGAKNKTFLYVDDTAAAAASKNARLTALLERLEVAADVEWHAELHGCMTVDEALDDVLQNGALTIRRVVASTDDAIEQIDMEEAPTRDALVNLITCASDRSMVATPIVAHGGSLFVGFNEQIWTMKLGKH